MEICFHLTLYLQIIREQGSLSSKNRIGDSPHAAVPFFQGPISLTPSGIAAVLVGLIHVNPALAQTTTAPAPASTPAQELRRLDQRERSQREERERTPDVRLTPAAPLGATRLPTELNCFVIQQLTLKTPPAEKPQVAAQFA